MIGSYTLKALYERQYKKTKNGVTFVPLKSTLFEPADYEWFSTPNRGVYLQQLTSMLGNFMEEAEFKPFKGIFDRLTWEQFQTWLDGTGVTQTEYHQAWAFLGTIYLYKLRPRINQILIDSGVVGSEIEINNLLNRYYGRISSRLPECYTQEEKEDLIDFLTIYLTIIINVEDVLGSSIAITGMDYLEQKGGFTLSPDTMVRSEYAERLIHVLSSEEMYILSNAPNAFSMMKNEENILKVFNILKKIEEDYTPSQLVMTNSGFRNEMVKGYVSKLIVDSYSNSNNNAETLYNAFKIMRAGGGNEVIERMKITPSNKKSFVRIQLEEIIMELWDLYSRNAILSHSVVNTRLNEFNKKTKQNGIKINIESNSLISPSKYRIIFLNDGETVESFNYWINDFVKSCQYKADISSSGGLEYNKLALQNNLVRIVDIRVHP